MIPLLVRLLQRIDHWDVYKIIFSGIVSDSFGDKRSSKNPYLASYRQREVMPVLHYKAQSLGTSRADEVNKLHI